MFGRGIGLCIRSNDFDRSGLVLVSKTRMHRVLDKKSIYVECKNVVDV